MYCSTTYISSYFIRYKFLNELRLKWLKCTKEHAPIYTCEGRTVIIGDGVKQSKEARKMPGVKKLHQESENSSKAEYIFGHLHGGVGILAGNSEKLYCLPISLKLHDGVHQVRSQARTTFCTGKLSRYTFNTRNNSTRFRSFEGD